jgi:glycosyltransferase involved in cell wall biosynthesis
MATPKLAAVILACNEDNVLARCLQSLQGVAELHVSIDTATTDGTEAVARQFTQNIYRHCLAETNSYSAARNGLQEAAEQATDAGWFLWIDPDEWLEPQHAQLLPGVIAEAEERDAQALMVRMYDLGLEGSGIDPSSWLNSKVFRRGMRFSRRRHEHLTPTDVLRLEAPQVVIHHQKRQRPDVLARNNGIKDNLQALVDDWQEFRDQRAACYAADCYAHAHRWHDAVAWYLEGLGCPDTVMGARGQLLQGLCRSYQNLGEFGKARQALFEFWSEDWHNTATALVELGTVALNAGSLDEAALYFRLLNATPDNVQSQLNVGATSPRESSVLGAAMVSCARGNYPEALQWLCKAIALAGRETPAHVALREKIVAAMTAAPEAAHAQ